MKVNKDLKEYIEQTIFPEYSKNETAHGVGHILDVINRSFELVEENGLVVNPDMVYTAAAYHDIAYYINRELHEELSAKIMYEDETLKDFFSDEERLTIKEAIEDHRASSKTEPRSTYGKILSSADRNNTVEQCLGRSYSIGKKLDPDATDQELFERAYDVLCKKFGVGGYAKHYFKDSRYEKFLEEIRELLKSKEVFIETQKNYIKSLKD